MAGKVGPRRTAWSEHGCFVRPLSVMLDRYCLVEIPTRLNAGFNSHGLLSAIGARGFIGLWAP